MNPIKSLIEQGEGISLDFKQVINDARKIAKSMVSFANTKGGILLIGVRDNGSIAGVKSEDEVHMLDLASGFHCKPEVKFTVEEYLVEGKLVLKVHVPEGREKPYYAQGEDDKWWVYLRVNDHCILASKTTVDFMKTLDKPVKLSIGNQEREILKFIAQSEKPTLKDICAKFNLGKRRAGRIIVDLMRAQAIQSHTTEKTEFFSTVY